LYVLENVIDLAPHWKHLLMFAGLRSGLSDEVVSQNKTTKALEHAYLRALLAAIGEVPKDISEGSLSLTEG
jgi:hypothetical protein